MSRKLLIETEGEPGGRYCEGCDLTDHNRRQWWCKAFTDKENNDFVLLEMDVYEDSTIRCPECLEAERRAGER